MKKNLYSVALNERHSKSKHNSSYKKEINPN
jgi:hypothetical protein